MMFMARPMMFEKMSHKIKIINPLKDEGAVFETKIKTSVASPAREIFHALLIFFASFRLVSPAFGGREFTVAAQ